MWTKQEERKKKLWANREDKKHPKESENVQQKPFPEVVFVDTTEWNLKRAYMDGNLRIPFLLFLHHLNGVRLHRLCMHIRTEASELQKKNRKQRKTLQNFFSKKFLYLKKFFFCYICVVSKRKWNFFLLVSSLPLHHHRLLFSKQFPIWLARLGGKEKEPMKRSSSLALTNNHFPGMISININ